jgi:hypothetical protein
MRADRTETEIDAQLQHTRLRGGHPMSHPFPSGYNGRSGSLRLNGRTLFTTTTRPVQE